MSKRHSNIFQWTATLYKLIESYITGTIYNDARWYKKVLEKLPKSYLYNHENYMDKPSAAMFNATL